MFQFTTTTVINSNRDFTTGKPLWSAQAADGTNPASFYVKRVNKFLANNVHVIYKAEAHDAEFAKVTIDLSQLSGTDGDIFRLHIYLGISQASQSSLYANDLQWKGKPLSVDFIWDTDAATTAEKLIKTINKYEIMVYNRKLLNVSNSGTYITIEATDEYQRFKILNIEKLDRDAYYGMGEYNVVRSLEDITEVDSNDAVTATSEAYFVGKEGFGTYPFLLHNLRLPTYERTRWLALNQDEAPIIGAKYNQYTIHYCVNRGILGDNAVGDLVKSRTTHVFYVNQTVSDEFEAALATIGTINTVDGYGSPGLDSVAHDIESLTNAVNNLNSTVNTLSTTVEQLQTEKQDNLTAGDGINITDNEVSVKLDGTSLTVSSDGLKVTE